MRGETWKKACSAAMALLVMSGGNPGQPLSQMLDRAAVTASADDDTGANSEGDSAIESGIAMTLGSGLYLHGGDNQYHTHYIPIDENGDYERCGYMTVNNTVPYTITLNADEGGIVSADPPLADAGQLVTLTVEPQIGFACSGITDEKNNTENTLKRSENSANIYTFTMPEEDVEFTANFKQVPIIDGLTYNSAGDYYEISSADALIALAAYVNDGNNARGLLFKQTAGIGDCRRTGSRTGVSARRTESR